jgi:ABC-type dipeptide/oligopeptide/nickel transport system permease subunit
MNDNTDTVIIVTNYIMWLFHLAIIVAAIVMAYKCNAPGQRLGPVIMAILFPEIYFFQRIIRQYVIKEKGYICYASSTN